jgi:hypothetical protein
MREPLRLANKASIRRYKKMRAEVFGPRQMQQVECPDNQTVSQVCRRADLFRGTLDGVSIPKPTRDRSGPTHIGIVRVFEIVDARPERPQLSILNLLKKRENG